MLPTVEEAIAEIRCAFVDHQLEVEPEPQGGAYVIVHDLSLGTQYRPLATWCGFLINFQYPYSDVYPHFIDGAVQRADGIQLGVAFQGPQIWQHRSAFQVSRRSNRWNPSIDSASTKLVKVIEWLRAQ